jgi:flagellar motor switch protein FliM
MTAAQDQTDTKKDIYDRILGRKGDELRLEPSIKTMVKKLAGEMQAALKTAGFEATFSLEGHSSKVATALFDGFPDGAVCALLGGKGTGTSAFLLFDLPTAGIIADLMLGSDPELVMPGPARPPTALESKLIRQFADLAGKGIRNTLSKPERPECLRLAHGADDIRDSGNAEPVVVFELSLGFGEAPRALSLAVTHKLLLQMARPEVETVRKPETAKHGAQNRNALSVKVPVTGSIMMPPMTLGELSTLRTGAVLALPEEMDTAVRMKIKDRVLYDCSLGRKGANYAICLQRPHKVLTDVLSGMGVPILDPDEEETGYE